MAGERKTLAAMYVGGMGAAGKNFHAEQMARRGFAAEAARIGELFRAGKMADFTILLPPCPLCGGEVSYIEWMSETSTNTVACDCGMLFVGKSPETALFDYLASERPR